MTSMILNANGVDDTAALIAAFNSGANSFELQGKFVISASIKNWPSNSEIFCRSLGAATIIAKPGVNFEYCIYGSGIGNLRIRGLVIDANQVNRAGILTTRSVPILLNDATNVLVEDCIFQNAIGTTLEPAFCFAVGGNSSKVIIKTSQALNGGTATKPADGFYCSASKSLIQGCIAENCTDTAFALESCSMSRISDCISDNCSAGGAIVNSSNTDTYGNSINNLTINNWNAPVTGGLQIGNPLSTSTGVLYDTIVDNVIIRANTLAGFGNGAAINVRSTGTPKPTNTKISNCTVTGASAQGILFNGSTESKAFGNSVTQTGASGIQFNNGVDHVAQGNTTNRTAFGIVLNSNASATLKNNTCSNTSYGVYAFDTSVINSYYNTVVNPTVAYQGKDIGATLNLRGALAGARMVGSLVNAPVGGAQSFKEPIYDQAGNLMGYVPIYAT